MEVNIFKTFSSDESSKKGQAAASGDFIYPSSSLVSPLKQGQWQEPLGFAARALAGNAVCPSFPCIVPGANISLFGIRRDKMTLNGSIEAPVCTEAPVLNSCVERIISE